MFLTETIAGRQPDPIIFPKLGITVDPNPVAFTAFGKEIYWYGIIIAMGFLLAVLYMMYRAKDFGLTQDDVLDMVLWAVPIGVICARAMRLSTRRKRLSRKRLRLRKRPHPPKRKQHPPGNRQRKRLPKRRSRSISNRRQTKSNRTAYKTSRRIGEHA